MVDMSEAKAIVRRFVEEYQTNNQIAVAQQLLAEDFVDHTPFPGFEGTKQGVLNLFAVLRSSFPDLHAEILHQVAEGDMVATRKVFRGTHSGAFFGIPATRRLIAFTVIDLVRVARGQIKEHWNLVDQTALLTQLQK